MCKSSSRPTAAPSIAPHRRTSEPSHSCALHTHTVAAAPAMERHTLLNELREHGRLPEAWERAHPRVAQLIRWAWGLRWGGHGC